MELFKIKSNKVESVVLNPFKLEKEIQNLVEKNTETFFELEFVSSEYKVGDFRLDTLCFEEESNSFVIIEYNEKLNKNLKRDDVDWTQSKIIFVSPSFNSYQKNSVNFKNLPFELWEIKRFSNETIVMNKHVSNSKESIDSLSNVKNQTIISSVSKEVKVFDEELHVSKTDKPLIQKWEELKEKLLELDNVELVPKRHYISFLFDKKTVCYFMFKKSSINLEMSRGNLNPDGTTSKNYFNIDDPKKISREGSWKWKSGKMGTIYKIKIVNSTDVDYLMFLIKQKYKNITK